MKVKLFLGLTFALSAVFYTLIIRAGSLGAHGGLYVLALMWCPGISALITRLVLQRNVRGQGWRLGDIRWPALAYVLPLIYASVAYGVVWLTGLGGVDVGRMRVGVGPAAVLHAPHNLFIQGFFDRVTLDTGPTRWLTGEFGAALAITAAVTAFVFWRARDAVALPNSSAATFAPTPIQTAAVT
ncbi:MAG TPA: hypothetical protein VIP11_01075 [Gemmatimonadaceae bacterium]